MKEKRNDLEQRFVRWLHQTGAIRVSQQTNPFWYTSGTIGPYYINTHFLYGSERKANGLLNFINKEKEDRLSCSINIMEKEKRNYKRDKIYKGVIDGLCQFIRDKINLDEVDYISGGERRDWFFSLILSDLLGKPHLTVFKDREIVLFEDGISKNIENADGKKVLHIADLVTEASSYKRVWIPAVKSIGGKIVWTVVVIDRKQGGAEFMKEEDISFFPVISLGSGLFEKLMAMGVITLEQVKMLKSYMEDPRESMCRFLTDNPQFLQRSLNGDKKIRERAKRCVEEDIYGLGRVK